MPNWNKTKYVFTGSENDISKLYNIISKPLSNNDLKSGDFGKNWLGFIVYELNLNPNDIDCRGWIENLKLTNKTTIKFTTYSAWSSCYELFELINRRFLSLKYYFISSEPGNCIYITNDKDKKYFKYSNKYDVIDKETILKLIKYRKKLDEMCQNQISSDSIYIRIPNK